MIDIRGSYVGNRRDSAEAIDFYRRGLIHVPYKVGSFYYDFKMTGSNFTYRLSAFPN
jgi:D-arabinose 1-dehydrogenase-like Zn-dependent alcohol dehydrogenase